MATTVTPLGAEFQINVNSGGNNGINGAQDLAGLALLPDGRFVVAYQSDYFGSATDTDPIFAIFNPNGTTSLAYRDAFNFGGHQKVSAVAARLDGGFGMVFQNDRHANGTVDSNGPNITYVPVSAAGGLLSPIAVADFNAGAGHDALQNPEIATLSSGRQVVAFERVWTAGTDHDVFLNVLNAAGTATQFSIANPLDVQANASWQANPSVAAIGNTALVVFEDGTGTTTASANIRARFFDSTSNTLGAAFTIADHAERLRTADVAAIDDHRYAITYGDQNDVWVKVLDSTTGILSAAVQLDVTGGFSLNPQVSGAPDAGFVVTWAQYNGADYDVRARLFDGYANAVGSDFIVTSLTDASQFTPDVAASGSRIFFAWTDFGARTEDTAAPGIRGRMFSVNVPPNDDFGGDGKSDLLWRHTSGTFTEWQSIGDGFNPNVVVVPFVDNSWRAEGSFDFSGDGAADLLWRNVASGQFTIWNSTGAGFAPNSYVNDFVDSSWHVAALADFNGDGKSDLLFRHTNGTFTEWQSTDSEFTPNVYINDAVDNTWHLVAAADFSGDGKADLLWRHNDGTVTEWRSDGNGFTPNTYVNLDVDPTWHVLGTGDFDGDGRTDLLFRHDNGTFTEWQSTGSGFTPNVHVNSAVDNSWQLAQVGDFNSDSKDDLLWRNSSGTFTEWQSTGDSFTPNVVVSNAVDADWTLVTQHHYDLI